MSIETSVNTVEYSTPGTTSSAIPFPFAKDEDLYVALVNSDFTYVGLSLDVDYSLTGAGDPVGGNLTLFVPLVSGVKLVISRYLEFLQPTDFANLGNNYAEVLGVALDRAIGLMQQLEYELGSRNKGLSRVPILDDYDVLSGGKGFNCHANKIKNMLPGTATDDAATVGQITGALSGVVVGGPGVITQFASPGPGASVTYKNQIIVVRDAGNNMSWAQICLETTANNYTWQIL